MTASAASGSGAAGRGPTVTLAPAVPTLRPSRPSSPDRWARIQVLSSGAYAATTRRAASVMSVTREKSTCAVRQPVSRSCAACASSRLVFP